MSKQPPKTYCSTIAPEKIPKPTPIPNAAMAFEAKCDKCNLLCYGKTQTEADAKLARSIRERLDKGELPKAIFNTSINP